MTTTFDEILHRADQLCTNVEHPSGRTQQQQEHRKLDTTARVDIALNDVFQCNESFWNRKRAANERTAELQAGMLLGSKGFKLAPLSSSPQKSGQSEANPEDLMLLPSADCTEVLNDVIAETSRRTRLEAERAFINQKIVDITHSKVRSTEPLATPSATASTSSTSTRVRGEVIGTAESPMELEFAKAVSNYIEDKKGLKLARELREASAESRDGSVVTLWEQTLAPLHTLTVHVMEVVERRNSVAFMSHVVESTLNYLNKQFLSHMETVVENNLTIARRGGNPTMLSLVGAFLNVKHLHPIKRVIQDGVYGPNGHALWEVVYLCLRVGDLEAVRTIAKSHLKNLPSNAALAICLSSLSDGKKISAEIRIKLRAEWRGEARTCSDIYKKAIYCALLGGDVPEVCENLENWLWMKMMPLKLDTSFSPAVFKELQRLISISYGEEYFTGGSGSVLIFFQALWLTGQYERAISLIHRNNMLVHAVHIALVLHVNDLLITTKDVSHPLRGSLFYTCISRAVHLSGDPALIIGAVDDNGVRHEGLIDRYEAEINISDAIAKVASDTELGDDIALAGQLYKAANRTDDAVRLACDALAKEMVQAKNTGKARKLAVWLASICKRNTEAAQTSSLDALPNLYLLIDLSTFFNLYRELRYDSCMEIIKKLKCIPSSPNEVQPFVSTFYMVSEQLRLVLPDLCLAVMTILNEQFSRDPGAVVQIRSQAKAIILYVSMIPYRFPSQINSKILQLNSRLD